MDSKSLGKQLKAYRAQQGWTIPECAEQIGISPRYLADMERGDKLPKLETFVSILNTLSASADEVLQDSLLVGYEPKSNAILQKLKNLPPKQRNQALNIFDAVIASLMDE